MNLNDAHRVNLYRVRRDYSSWTRDELEREYMRIGQELLKRDKPDSHIDIPVGYPYPNRVFVDDSLDNIRRAVRFFQGSGD